MVAIGDYFVAIGAEVGIVGVGFVVVWSIDVAVYVVVVAGTGAVAVVVGKNEISIQL